MYSWKCKECEVFLLTDVSNNNTSKDSTSSGRNNKDNKNNNAQKSVEKVVHEAVVWKLITGGGAVTSFLGMHVETLDKKITGTIVSSYGADGEFCTAYLYECGVYMIFYFRHHMIIRLS